MSDKSFMLIAALLSALCVIWAICIKSYGMAAALIINTIYSFVMAFKIEKIS